MAGVNALLSFATDLATFGLAGIASPEAAEPWWWGPVLTASLAVMGGWIAIAFDRRKATNQELIKKRIEVYEKAIPKANDLLCYFTCLGNWRALTPDIIIAHKRDLDRIAYVYGPLFSRRTIAAYHGFIHACFKTFVGSGKPAQIRADLDRLKSQWGTSWDSEWDVLFVAKPEAVEVPKLRTAYKTYSEALAREIGARG